MQMGTEVGVIWPQAQDGLGSPAAGQGERAPPLEPLERARPCPHLDHRLLAPELEGDEFVWLKLPSLWLLAAACPGRSQ